MTIVEVGSSGLIGAKDMNTLTGQCLEAIAASPTTAWIP